MTNFRKIVIIAATVLIVVQLLMFNYTDFSRSVNSGGYLGIAAMILVIISMVLSNRHEKQQVEN